jgi:hypothetical protein
MAQQWRWRGKISRRRPLPARPRSEFAVGVDAALWKGPDGQRWLRATWSARWLAVVVMLGDDRSVGRLNGRHSSE